MIGTSNIYLHVVYVSDFTLCLNWNKVTCKESSQILCGQVTEYLHVLLLVVQLHKVCDCIWNSIQNTTRHKTS